MPPARRVRANGQQYQRGSAVPIAVPIPLGLDTVNSPSALPPQRCPFLVNLIGADNGMRSRMGHAEWVTGMSGTGGDDSVRTIIPYTGSAKSGSKDRLFGVTKTGIYQNTTSTAAPGAKLVTFGTTTGDAGYGTWWVTATAAGRFAFYVDEENGAYMYTESTDTWAAAAGITNVAAADLAAGVNFKSRNWFVEDETPYGWYLPAGAVLGAATKFNFGEKFRAGGVLAGLYNWTYDGGAGSDDFLVAVSSAGDIVIYEGTDPSSVATFGLRGVWYGGGVPYGRRLATNFGGDMAVLTAQGTLSLSQLVVGKPLIDQSMYATRDIANMFNQLMTQKRGLRGWSIRMHPQDNAIIVTVPTNDGSPTTQLAMSMSTKGWSTYRDLPITCCESWNGSFYFGTQDGRTCLNKDFVDNVKLSAPTEYTPIDYSMITRFSNLGVPAQKQVQLIRVALLSGSASPAVRAEARFKYNRVEAARPAPSVKFGAGAWDGAHWDQDSWSGDLGAVEKLFGGKGIGAQVSVALRGLADAPTVIAGIDLMVTRGSFT